MNNYVQIKKKYLLALFVVFILVACSATYYFWCANHPKIVIQVGSSSSGKEGITIEAPKIAIGARGIAEPSATVELKVNNIIMQHEFMLQTIQDNYKSGDIRLDMKIKDGYPILKYYGTVINLNDEKEKFESIIQCDFTLDAEISHE